MTIDFYALIIGISLAILTVVGCMAMLFGWFFYLDMKLRHFQNVDGRNHECP